MTQIANRCRLNIDVKEKHQTNENIQYPLETKEIVESGDKVITLKAIYSKLLDVEKVTIETRDELKDFKNREFESFKSDVRTQWGVYIALLVGGIALVAFFG